MSSRKSADQPEKSIALMSKKGHKNHQTEIVETGVDSASNKYLDEIKTSTTKRRHSTCSMDQPFLAIGHPVAQSRNFRNSNFEIIPSSNTHYIPTQVSLQKGSNRVNGFLNNSSQRRNINKSNVAIREYLQQQQITSIERKKSRSPNSCQLKLPSMPSFIVRKNH